MRHQPKQFSLFGEADKGTLLFVIDKADFFLSHRLPIALTAKNSGYEVHVAAPFDYAAGKLIKSYSFIFHPLPPMPEGISLLADIKTIFALRRIFRAVAPDLVHLIALKPTLYGGIVARMAKIPAVMATVIGIRRILSRPASIKAKFIRFLYGIGFNHPHLRVAFQNTDDRDAFLDLQLITRKQIALIRGAGVNMQQFYPIPESHAMPVVMLAGKMRRDKGVGEFAGAAEKLLKAGVKARFVLVGNTDPAHPETLESGEIQAWQEKGIIEWWGEKNDMPIVYAQAHIVCLPSYHERLPKVLVEAAASGRAIVATDVPGCRDVVSNAENGLLVPAKNVDELAAALSRLITSPDLRNRMGQLGRRKVVAEFSTAHVVDKTLGVYESLRRS
jgi:glycosyltransferase involved in cell wall biosynthesis